MILQLTSVNRNIVIISIVAAVDVIFILHLILDADFLI